MTITDIAKLAGVGVSTVSRVLNNHPDVKAETREKILEIIKENNYIPNNSARMLKQTTNNNIGILVKGVFNPFFSAILKSITTMLEKLGYCSIVYYHNEDNDIKALLSFIKEKRLQGAICLGGNFIDVKEDSFADVDAAIVLVCVDFNENKVCKGFSTVSIRNEVAGYTATKYLIDNQHNNIGIMLGDKKDLCIGRLRLEGYLRALKESNIEFNEGYVIHGNYEMQTAYIEAKDFITNHPEITAIFATSDVMAIGLAKAIADLNLKIGEDISIIGFDGTDIAKYYEPTITTIKQPQDKLANISTELLVNLLNHTEENKQISLETELVEGNSVCTRKVPITI